MRAHAAKLRPKPFRLVIAVIHEQRAAEGYAHARHHTNSYRSCVRKGDTPCQPAVIAEVGALTCRASRHRASPSSVPFPAPHNPLCSGLYNSIALNSLLISLLANLEDHPTAHINSVALGHLRPATRTPSLTMPREEYTRSTHAIHIGPLGYIEGVTLAATSDSIPQLLYIGGLPYALPPVGPYRFRRPRPLPEHYRYGTKASPGRFIYKTAYCPQPRRAGQIDPTEWDEDCLQLNIHIPTKPKPAKGWPV